MAHHLRILCTATANSSVMWSVQHSPSPVQGYFLLLATTLIYKHVDYKWMLPISWCTCTVSSRSATPGACKCRKAVQRSVNLAFAMCMNHCQISQPQKFSYKEFY